MLSRQEFFVQARTGTCAPWSTEQLYFAYEVYLTCPISRVSGQAAYPGECGRCGNCCRRPWRIEVSYTDVQRWIDEKRTDLLESLECRPRRSPAASGWGQSTDALQTAVKAVACGEEHVVMALSIARAVASGGDSFVLPKAGGCKYLIDGEETVCGIYDTRPDVCRNFPAVELS